jgi:hypothetical protein
VFRLEDGQQLVEVPIQAGLNDGTMTQVASSDLKPGDRIVVEQTLGGGGGRRGGPQQRMPRGM